MFKTIKTNPAVLVYPALILITLFNHTIEVTEGNFVAHYILAGVFQDQGQFNKAVEHYEESLRIKPGYVAPAQLMEVLSGKRRHGNG